MKYLNFPIQVHTALNHFFNRLWAQITGFIHSLRSSSSGFQPFFTVKKKVNELCSTSAFLSKWLTFQDILSLGNFRDASNVVYYEITME